MPPRKKTPAPDQPSLFENPAGPTQAEFRLALIEEFKKSKADYYVEANKKRRKKSRLDSIRLGDDSDTPGQTSFAHITPVGSYPTGCFPAIGSADRVEAILEETLPGDWIGLDFEFNPSNDRITIIGVANADEAAGCKWDMSFAYLLHEAMASGVKMVGHWVLGADKPILEKALGVSTPSASWIDSMGLHFLCNQCLTKLPGKESDGEGSLGYMSLHHATCINTDISAGYKSCVGIGCLGQREGPDRAPCPEHFATGYCAVDAYAGLISAINCRDKMNRWGIPWRCYEEWHETTEGAILAENRGLRINKPFVENFDRQVAEKKEKLFQVPSDAKRRKFEPFNPKSGKQVAEWFKARRIDLVDAVGKASTDKKIVMQALEREIQKYGFSDVKDFTQNADSITLSDVDEALYKLFLYKDSGKGLKSWFDEDKHLRHHDGAWWAHPRFNTTGASTTRMASSGPNFTNVAAHGWGASVKEAVLPRDSESCIVCADASQLELRILFYECGQEAPKGDFFKWLLAKADGKFEKAAERMHGSGRDIAKRVSHAANYLEGLKLLDDWQLGDTDIKKLVDRGALRIFHDWRFAGKTVAFTGSNLAETLFGNKTNVSRKMALDLQFDVYFALAVPFLAEWHRRLSALVERGWVQLRTGHRLELLDYDAKNLKAGAAYFGQGGGAQYVQAKMREANRRYPNNPWAIMVHDEIAWDTVPRSWSAAQKLDFVKFLWEEEVPQFPGLLIPWKTKTGPSWGEAKEIVAA